MLLRIILLSFVLASCASTSHRDVASEDNRNVPVEHVESIRGTAIR